MMVLSSFEYDPRGRLANVYAINIYCCYPGFTSEKYALPGTMHDGGAAGKEKGDDCEQMQA